jgi:hypothetical protein
MPTYRRNILSPSSGLKMETVCFSDMLASTCKSTHGAKTQKKKIIIEDVVTFGDGIG